MSEEKLPKGWRSTKLGNTLSLEYGKSLPKKDRSGFEYPVMGSNGEIDRHSEYLIKGPGIVVGRKGSHGEVVWVENNFFPIDTTYYVNPKPIIDLRFAFYFLRKSDLKSLNRSTAIPGLNRNDAYNINITLPTLLEQQRIVARLDALFGHLDSLREKLDRIPVLLKNFRQKVLSQAVTGELTKEWREWKDLGEWESKKLNDVILKIQAGRNFSAPEIPVSEGKVGLVKISAVTWDEFNEKETKTVENADLINPNYFINKGDFLISRANTLELVGSSVIVREINHQIMLSDKVWRIQFDNQTTKWFVHRFLKSALGRKEIEARANGNQLSMRNLSQNNFRDIDLNVPPIEEQQEIIHRIDTLFAFADKIESQYQSLKVKIDQLPQAILAKAFRGELVEQKVKEF